ncbi:MAG: hypothetical protein ACI36T_04605 [Eggerthellaceae bacterium]
MENSIVLFESEDGQVVLPVRVDMAQQEIWLSRAQLAALFGRDVKTIGKHVNNALREELAGQEDVVVAKFATTTQHGAIEGKTQTHLDKRLRSLQQGVWQLGLVVGQLMPFFSKMKRFPMPAIFFMLTA